jgi:hypothetical protein
MSAHDERFQIERTTDGWQLLVAAVDWDGHMPSLRWSVYRRWKREPNSEQLERARAACLRNRGYFRVCRVCGKHFLLGHMIETGVCHGCAEKELGVAF